MAVENFIGDIYRKEIVMRLDSFLSAARIFKSRTLASEAISSSMVFVDGLEAKPAKDVTIGSILEIDTLTFYKKIEIRHLPPKNFPKSKAHELYDILQERSKT